MHQMPGSNAFPITRTVMKPIPISTPAVSRQPTYFSLLNATTGRKHRCFPQRPTLFEVIPDSVIDNGGANVGEPSLRAKTCNYTKTIFAF